MKPLLQKALRGPNYWSNVHPKLIQTRLQLESGAALHQEQINRCLTFIREQGVDLEWPGSANQALVLASGLALALQRAAACSVHFWQLAETVYPNIWNWMVEYELEKAGLLAVQHAMAMVNLIQQGHAVDFDAAVAELKIAVAKESPTEELAGLIELAHSLSIPVLSGKNAKSIQLGYGCRSIQLEESGAIETAQATLEQGLVGRIPILAVTGSNGKTTTTRLLAHILHTDGKSVGFTTSDGVYIGAQMIDEGDTTGPASAQLVLRNRAVEVAVLESARGGIVRAGLGFDCCDVAVVTNVQDDHLGISDIETMEDLARVKAVVVKAVKPGGWAILNADNAYTVAMGKAVACRVAWFSRNADNPILKDARRAGAPVAFVERGQVVVQTVQQKWSIASLEQVPITFQGTLDFMTENVLAASLAASVFGVKPETIAEALRSFYPSAEQTPGRMNIFEIRGNTVLIDFAHNPDGFSGIREFLGRVQSPFKIGIIVGTGDRKDEDTMELGRIAAQMFDLTLIHQVKFLRGKTAEELVDLLVAGMHQQNPQAKWLRVPDAEEPLGYALQLAKPGSYITALSDVLTHPAALVERYRSGEHPQ